jgi:hypothetical protein
MNTLKHYMALCSCLLFTLSLSAQRSTEGGLFVGMANYQGDLAPSPAAIDQSKLALGGLYRYMMTDHIGIKGSVTWGRIAGDDRNRPGYNPRQRTWTMTNSILEMAVHGEWFMFGTSRYGNTGLHLRQYSPFFSVGIGAAFTNPKVRVPAEDRAKLPEPGATSTFLVVPLTGGLRLDILDDFLVTLEFGSRITFSDYLDGVSKNGRSNTNDWYMFGGISFIYIISESVGGKGNRW